jgi:preprotein translocase SecE subunit
MARNRQRSKQRQAERRARRLEQQGASPPQQGGIPGVDAPRVEPVGGPAVDPELAAGAPPEEEGRSDFALDDEPRLDDDGSSTEAGVRLQPDPAQESEAEALEEIEDWEAAEDFAEDDLEPDAELTGEGEAGYAVRGRRGRAAAEAHKDRPRVVQFLIAVWAELQRVQWPNRQALVTLTGVVLGFVLIAGGYLGLLDAIFSELIKAIL